MSSKKWDLSKKKKLYPHWHTRFYLHGERSRSNNCNLFEVIVEPRRHRVNIRGIISNRRFCATGSERGGRNRVTGHRRSVHISLSLFFSTVRSKKIAYSHQRTVYCNQLRIQFALIIRIPITGPLSSDFPTMFVFFNPTVPLSLVSPITICLAIYFSLSFYPSPEYTFHARIFVSLLAYNSPRSSFEDEIDADGF